MEHRKYDLIIEILEEIIEELKSNYCEHHPGNSNYSFHIERLITLVDKLK